MHLHEGFNYFDDWCQERFQYETHLVPEVLFIDFASFSSLSTL